jgi:hypothetical protein
MNKEHEKKDAPHGTSGHSKVKPVTGTAAMKSIGSGYPKPETMMRLATATAVKRAEHGKEKEK